jgi:hypothetical protein
MSTKHSSLTWPDRLALIEAYGPTNQAICSAFDSTPDEVQSALNMANVGMIKGSSNFDTAKYGNPFSETASTNKQGTATVHAAPESATKRTKVPQKRGRKGEKITVALQSVPTTPVTVESFIQRHQVSLAVLRQSKRFLEKMEPATATAIGTIHVRQNKATKQLEIWREPTV